MMDQHGGGNAMRNKKRTAGYSGGGKIDYSHGCAPNENPKQTDGYKKTSPASTSKKGKFFTKGKGPNMGGVNQYGGSSNNENPFQIN